MTPVQARTLQIGDRVEWRADLAENAHNNARGTVADVMGLGFLVRFDDGEEVQYPFAHARKVNRI